MSEGSLRREAAELLAEVRRFLEREQAVGGDEAWASLLGSSPAAGAEPPPAVPAAWGAQGLPPAPAVVLGTSAPGVHPPPQAPAAASWRTAAPASGARAQAAPVAPPPPPTIGSLFGDEDPMLPPPAPHAPSPPALPLHPAGGPARAGILAESLPVLDGIASEVRACTRCGLCEGRTQAVPGTGTAQSGIVFVGEAPGAEEDRRGEPFVGRAGELLTRIIEAMDRERLIPGVKLDRETVYICNVIKCRPPENRNPLPHEVESCAPYLHRQLEALKPRVICCLGKFAAELLLGVKGTIANLRGRVYLYGGAKLIVTYHPAACLRNPGYKRPVWEDMQLLAREYLNA